ncbi:MAG: polysaccharide pyruvyl transferase family protein [Pseudohongiellaceae bacterium]
MDNIYTSTGLRKSKIGIVTFHYTTNYGALLQAYALTRLLTSLGYTCEVVDYRQWRAIKAYAKALFLNRNALGGLLKLFRFSRFMRENLPISRKVAYRFRTMKALTVAYEALIVGSDEVWKINSFRGYDAVYFLGFASDGQKRLSFSASAGSTSSFGPLKDEICGHLSRFDAVSVRDRATSDILSRECSIEAVNLLDPTLLIDFPRMSENRIKEDAFLLVYGSLSAQEARYVRVVARDLRCRVISIGYMNQFADDNFIGVGVGDWVEYFRSAKRVFTTFFHGAIFSLKFHEEVFIFRRNDKDYKINQLTFDLNLVREDIECSTADGSGKAVMRLGFSSSTAQLISDARDKASVFLKNAFAGG